MNNSSMATTKIADNTMARMERFRDRYGKHISFKHIVTEGAERFMDEYEAQKQGDTGE